MDDCLPPQEGSGAIARSSFTWIINNYRNLHNAKKMRDRVMSPIASTTAGSKKHKWRIELYPRGTDITCKDWLCIFLVNVSDDDVVASCNFIILDEKDRMVRQKSTDKQLFRKNHNEDIFWGSGSFFKCDYMFDEKNRILIGDTLKIHCVITEIVIEVSAMCYKTFRF